MTSPMPEPTIPPVPKPSTAPTPVPTPSSAMPLPGGVKPFTPSLTPQQGTPSGTSSSLTGYEKAVWFQRPRPLSIGSGDLYSESFHDPSQPYFNTWYDKADVKSAYDLLDPTTQLLFTALANDMGNNRSGRGVFEDMVDQSAYQSTIGNKVTPQQLAMQIAYQRGILNDDGSFDASKVQADGSANPYGTTTSRTKSIKLTDPDSAHAVLDQALTTYLGRRTNPEELQQFISNLNRHERQNATVTTQTQTTAAGEGVDANGNPMKGTTATTSVTKGGSNSQQYAVDYARGMEGAAEFQAATGYLDEFLQAIKNPMDVVS